MCVSSVTKSLIPYIWFGKINVNDLKNMGSCVWGCLAWHYLTHLEHLNVAKCWMHNCLPVATNFAPVTDTMLGYVVHLVVH